MYEWCFSPQLYHGEKKLIFNEMMMRSASYNMLSWIFIVLAHWNNQSLLFLLNAACLAEKQQIPIIVFGLTWSGLEPKIFRTRGEHANHYTTNVVPMYIWLTWFISCFNLSTTTAFLCKPLDTTDKSWRRATTSSCTLYKGLDEDLERSSCTAFSNFTYFLKNNSIWL